MVVLLVGCVPARANEPEVTSAGGDGATKGFEAAPATLEVTVRVVGPDEDLGETDWVSAQSVTAVEGQTALQVVSGALRQVGLAFSTATDAQGNLVASVASPLDGQTWGPNAASGDGWLLLANGVPVNPNDYHPRQADELLLYYRLTRTHVTVSAVGPGGTGEVFWLRPVERVVAPGQTAWDVCLEALEAGGYVVGSSLYYGDDADGNVQLGSLSALGPNGVTGESWQLFVNGSPAQEGANRLTLHDGDDLCWYYANTGDMSLPDFATSAIAAAKRAGSERLEGRVYTAWGRRLTSYLRRAEEELGSGVEPTLQVLGDRVEVALGGTVVSLSTQSGEIVSVTERGQLAEEGRQVASSPRGASPELAPIVAAGTSFDVALAETRVSSPYAVGVDGSIYYVESTGVVYRLVVL